MSKVCFKVFGSQEAFEIEGGEGKNFLDLFSEMGLFPDDYIITFEGTPLPMDSQPVHNDYTIYKVPSGG